MKHYEFILAIDPSGSFSEGKGTTGWVLMDAKRNALRIGWISAGEYLSAEEYYDAHRTLLSDMHYKYGDDIAVVCEDYVLYPNRAGAQSYSKLETPRLIGILLMACWDERLPIHFQTAAEVKPRWSNTTLMKNHILKGLGFRKGYAVWLKDGKYKKVPEHCIDAVRHACHFLTFKNGERRTYAPVQVTTKGFDNYENS